MNNETKGVKDFYNATANEWADKWYPDETMLPLLQKYISLFKSKPYILDAGCGAGYESMRLANLGADVVGVDFSEESIKIARSKNPNSRFEVMDCRQLNKNFGVFDGVISLALIIHFQDCDLQLIFNNFKDIISRNGFLFVAFSEGDGFSEKRSHVEINGEKYNRSVWLHRVERIIEAAKMSNFKYFDEWFLEEEIGSWKYLVFQA